MHKITKDSLEEKVKANLREHCNNEGAHYDHNSSGNMYTQAGRCDYNILNNNGITLYVECKSLGGKLTPAQALYKRRVQQNKGIFLLYDGGNDEDLINLLRLGG